MIEIILLLVAVPFAAFVILRTPKLTLPKQFESVEREIEEWLRQPMTPYEKESTVIFEKSLWVYGQERGAKPSTTFGQTVISPLTASKEQGQNQWDFA